MFRLLSALGSIQVGILLVNLIRAKYLSVVLGPFGYGIVATIDQVVVFLVHLAGLGLPFTSVKFLSKSHSEGLEKFRASYVSFLRAMSGLAFAATGIAYLLLFVKPDVFGSDLTPYRQYMLIAVLTVPVLMLKTFFVHTLASAQRSVGSAVVSFASTAALAGGACIGVTIGGIGGLYTFSVTGGAVVVVSCLMYLRRKEGLRLRHASAGIVRELRRYPEVVSFSLMLYVALSTYSLSMFYTRYVVFSSLGEAEAGLLQATLGLALAMGAVVGAMNSLYLTPLVNRNLPSSEKVAHAHEFLDRIALMLAVVTLPALLFPGLSLTILFSSEFVTVAGVLYLFVLWQCLYQLVNVYQQVLIGLDDVAFYSVTTSLGFAMAAALSPVLISSMGLAGAAVALMSGILFNGLTTALRLRFKYGAAVPLRSWSALALCCGSIVAAGRIFPGPEVITVGAVGVRLVYALTVAGCAWLLLPPSDQRALSDGLERVLRR